LSATRIFDPGEGSPDQHQRRLEALFKHLTAGEREAILQLVENVLALRSVLLDAIVKYENLGGDAAEFGPGIPPNDRRH
jgi:hypothetical protein